MKMFLGEYSPNITSGNRIVLPKKHREQLADNAVVLSKGFEKCILIYDMGDWGERVERQIDNLASEGLKKAILSATFIPPRQKHPLICKEGW